MGKPVDLKELLKRVVELVMPDLRHYYRVVKKGRVMKAYASDGSYWADVQPLRNDDSDDANEPVITRIEIPILWGGPERGVVCPPTVGTLCDIEYYNGDPDYPRISNFRWAKNKAPACELGAFTIQQTPDIYIKITAGGTIINKTTADMTNTISGAKNETVGANWSIDVTGTTLIKSSVSATVQAPQINLVGNLSATGTGGARGTETKNCNTTQTGTTAQTGDVHFTGNLLVTGNITATGNVADANGAKTMAGMRSTYNGHTHTGNGGNAPAAQM